MLELNKTCFIFLFLAVSYFGVRALPMNFGSLKIESYFEILCKENDRVFTSTVSNYKCQKGECLLMLADNKVSTVFGSCNLK